MEEPLGTMQHSLVVKASQEAGFSETKSILVNSSERDQYAMPMEEAWCRFEKILPDQLLSKDL